MTNVRIDLTKIKASGVYTFEFDQSETIIVSQQTIKLVCGFSRTGPYNTAVFLQDTATAISVFGNIDPFLERRNSFFHRTILKGLETGPVFAVNLLNLNNEIPSDPLALDESDKVPYRSFSLNTNMGNGQLTEKLLSSYYNKERFWFTDEDSLLATRSITDLDKALSFVNVGQTKQTIIIRKPQDLLGFDITAIEWYGQEGVPEFIYPYDLISDYFIEVISVNGDFGSDQYAQLSIDPIFSEFFDANGLIKDKIDDFLELPEVTFNARYVGSVIPDFTDQNNINFYIQNLINISTNSTGLFCAIDETLIDNLALNGQKLDMVGHNLTTALTNDDFDEIDFLSYKKNIKETLTHNVKFNSNLLPFMSFGEIDADTTTPIVLAYADDGNNNLAITFDRTKDPLNNNFDSIINSIKVNETIVPISNVANTDYYYNLIIGLSVTNTTFTIVLDLDYSNIWVGQLLAVSSVNPPFVDGFQNGKIQFMQQDSQYDTIPSDGSIIAFKDSTLYLDYINGNLVDGDIVYTDDNGSLPTEPKPLYIRILEQTTNLGINAKSFDTIKILAYEDVAQTVLDTTFSFTKNTYSADKTTLETLATRISIVSLTNAINSEINIVSSSDGNKFVITQTEAEKLNVGDFIIASDEAHLTRIVTMATDTTNVNLVNVETYEPVKIKFNKVDKILAMEDIVDSYDLTYLRGFELKDRHIPNGTDNRMNEIMGVLTDTNLFDTLADKDLIQYRYIVDSFGGGLEPQCKSILAMLAKQKRQAMAILNVPSIKTFKDSIEPRFTDSPTPSTPNPLLNVRYISEGGNLSLNPSFKFGLASETTGSKFVGYFSPYITIRENSRNKQIPPAMFVANNFVRKFINGTPYAIVAGRRRGLIEDPEVVGLEYNFNTSQREYLEPYGINPIITKRGVGIEIYANQTGFQNINSAFNNLHVRDLLISLEQGIESILENYVFEFNVPSIRLEIETNVRGFLEDVRANGGLLDFQVIINSSNNPGEIIDQNFGILDVIIEPPRGIQKFINRITVTNTGSIAQGGFTIQ